MWLVMVLIVAMVLIACLIYFRVPLAKKDELAKTVSIIGTITAAIALGWAAYTYTDSKERQNKSLATSIYQEHMKTSMDAQNKHYLGTARFAQMDPQNIPDNDKDEYEKYQWYVGNSLFNFESISELDDDPLWKKTFRGFIKGHRNYIRNNIGDYRFPCERYSDKILKLVKEETGKDCSKE